MSLYLKYRPQNFSSVVGQPHIVSTLKNALKREALTHAYLFCGPRGTGKTSLARIIAKSLNCTNRMDGVEPCDECDNCKAVLASRLVDLIEIDAASNRGIDEIRELREKILFAPTQGKSKVYIIDEVHMLTKEAFNALLKTLEEPPTHAYFILATTEAHKIPETIVSRCQQFNFKRITPQDIVERLTSIAKEEEVHAEPDALELIAKLSAGGLRDAIGLFEQMNIDGSVIYQEVVSSLGITGHMLIESFYQALLEKESLKAINILNQVNSQGQNLKQFCSELVSFLREQMLLGINEKKEISNIVKMIDIFSEAKQLINQAHIPQLPLEIAVIKSCDYEGKGTVDPAKAPEKTKESVPEESLSELMEPEKKKTESKTVVNEVTFEEIKSNWQRIVDHIETPFIRMSFVDGDPVSFEGGVLTMHFKSSTFMDKVLSSTNQSEIIAAFEAVLSIKPTLKAEVKKIDLKPVVKKETDDSGDAEEKPKNPSVIEMAKEVFGG